jgi:hypothetical protein
MNSQGWLVSCAVQYIHIVQVSTFTLLSACDMRQSELAGLAVQSLLTALWWFLDQTPHIACPTSVPTWSVKLGDHGIAQQSIAQLGNSLHPACSACRLCIACYDKGLIKDLTLRGVTPCCCMLINRVHCCTMETDTSQLFIPYVHTTASSTRTAKQSSAPANVPV